MLSWVGVRGATWCLCDLDDDFFSSVAGLGFICVYLPFGFGHL